ncbi:MAG: phage holin family protein [Thermoleophilaceae bacterium]|nr:phage holin family protein [Thermoleophilaceae bacterium]
MADQNLNDRPVAELVQQMSQQTATLVRKELQMAQLEMKEKGKRAGIGAGLFGGAGGLAFYGLGLLLAAIVLALATFLEPWIAALIVALVVFAAAGGLALAGKQQVEQATPLAPDQAIESTKRDVDEIKGKAGRA